jgi:hypothetical protein
MASAISHNAEATEAQDHHGPGGGFRHSLNRGRGLGAKQMAWRRPMLSCAATRHLPNNPRAKHFILEKPN